jgi:hypothetical protein
MAGDVTIDDILDELAASYQAEERQAGDIDARQLAERMGEHVSERQALYRMEKITQQRDDFIRILVFDTDARVYRWVLRKVTT